MKYLYGASVQGIQNFILETNKLQEIAGGSEFVEQICTTEFKSILGDAFEGEQLIQGAAGIIRYLFEENEKALCEEIVYNFPYKIQKQAPGIIISQAVVEIKEQLIPDHISKLIQLLDEQRNNVQLSFLEAPMIAERSRSNGQAAVPDEKKEYLSKQQQLKRKHAKESNALAEKIGLEKESLPMTGLDELSGKGNSKDQWLAVIHADGNSLGKLIIKANKILNGPSADVKDFYRSFSQGLDNATKQAAQIATNSVLGKEIESWSDRTSENKIPIRPVLLGGDDLTVIIKAKYALEFSRKFMDAFEEKTKELVYEKVLKRFGDFIHFQQGLTICVGIAYIKPNYPFHYAENLAQQLCKAAKKVSKNINDECAPSSLMFHQVHSSFVGKWEDIMALELSAKDVGSFAGGPYFLKKLHGYKSIEEIQKWSAVLNITNRDGERTSLKAQIRSLITEYIDNTGGARQYEIRLRQINKKEKFEEIGFSGKSIFDEKTKTSHAWDIIKLATIQQENTVNHE